ncbi:hypothetical protein J6590_096825 [Homalodisca vitripennis]|nr:hypothetical protein J6590_096825 [Homalodisca vitripennis]
MNRLRVLFRFKGLLQVEVKLKIVKAVVFPVIVQVLIDGLQKSAVRFVYGLRKFDHVSQYRRTARILPIKCIFKLQVACLVHKVLLTGKPSYLRGMLQTRAEIRDCHTRQDAMLEVPKVRLGEEIGDSVQDPNYYPSDGDGQSSESKESSPECAVEKIIEHEDKFLVIENYVEERQEEKTPPQAITVHDVCLQQSPGVLFVTITGVTRNSYIKVQHEKTPPQAITVHDVCLQQSPGDLSHKKLLYKSAAVREDATTRYHSPRCMSTAVARRPVCHYNRSHKKLLYKSAAVREDATTSYHSPRCMSAAVARGSVCHCNRSHKKLLYKSAAVREDATTSYHSPRCMSAAVARGPVCHCNRSHKKLLYKSAAVREDATTSYHSPRCMSAAVARGPVCHCNRSHKKLLYKSAAVREDATTSYHSPRCMSAAVARGPVCHCNRSHKKLL